MERAIPPESGQAGQAVPAPNCCRSAGPTANCCHRHSHEIQPHRFKGWISLFAGNRLDTMAAPTGDDPYIDGGAYNAAWPIVGAPMRRPPGRHPYPIAAGRQGRQPILPPAITRFPAPLIQARGIFACGRHNSSSAKPLPLSPFPALARHRGNFPAGCAAGAIAEISPLLSLFPMHGGQGGEHGSPVWPLARLPTAQIKDLRRGTSRRELCRSRLSPQGGEAGGYSPD